MKVMELLYTPQINRYSLISVLVLCVLLSISYGEVGEDTAIKPSDVAWINSLFYLPKEVRVRKEYRMLSEQERSDYHTAILMLKHDTSVAPNKYDLFVSLHARRSSRNSAHKGTGFLGWHRIFTLLFENALREKIPNVTVPYWDCTLDAVLPLPRKSSIWSEDFMGNGDGYVVTGAFKSWTTQIGKLYRTVGITEGPLADQNITRLLEHLHIGNISLPGMRVKSIEHVLEETHNRVHRWVGGEMREIETAGEDPVFYIFHSFVNYIWEDFRANQRAHGIDPETDWAFYYGQTRHHKYSPMGLGNLMAFDGSNELFAENIVHTQRPWCSRQQTDCKSPLLYCNVTVEKCVPWTINEYYNIKSAASRKNITFSNEAEGFIQFKISKGYEELFAPKTVVETTTQLYVDHSHSHDNDVTDIPHSDDSDEHNHNEHSHKHRHVLKVLKAAITGYITMIILGCLIAVRVLFCICSKCCSERKKRVKGTCKKYNMDGIANLNYLKDNGKMEEHVPTENRPDNIYTITVSCPDNNTIGSSTYVRFSRYVIGKSGGKERNQGIKCEENVIAEQIENGGNEVKQLELKHKANSDIRKGLNMHNVTTKPNDDYMDMTFALTESEAGVQNTSDIFERIANDSDLASDINGEDNEARLNSVENENFDLPLATTENSFAFLDDYDNVYFTREAEKENLGVEMEDTVREFVHENENVDKSVCGFISSAHM